MHPFALHLQAYIQINPAEWEAIKRCLNPVSYGRGDRLLTSGETCGCLFFMERGWVRFFDWGDGEEQTLYFTAPGNLFTSAESFSQQVPGKETILALEDAQGWRIPYAAVQRLYGEVPLWNSYIRQIILNANKEVQQISQEMRTLTATQRYKGLLAQQPDLLRVVRLKELASYLGVTPESRIRRQYGN